MSAKDDFIALRDRFLAYHANPALAEGFRWPALEHFNWALDYFDPMAAENPQIALQVIDEDGTDGASSYEALARRSAQVANFLASHGLRRGDPILLMLGNVIPLWEVMLGAMKLGAVIVPAATLLGREELSDRLERGAVRCIVTHSHLCGRFEGLAPRAVRIVMGEEVPGWQQYDDSRTASPTYLPQVPTRADDLLLLYFTSGTTARPKLVAHTHASYPIGHLTTMYWIGLRPGDVHLNLSSPGWAKHAWSCVFAPWNAQATVLAYQYARFDARALLDCLVRYSVTTFCAPPTVWRMLIQQELHRWPVRLREAVSAGEPLNPEVIVRVKDSWGLTIRDGYGQTETTAQVGNPPGQPVRPGAMGRALPGCPVVLLDGQGNPAEEGEICIRLSPRPTPIMREYLGDPERTAQVTHGGYYHTGDVAMRDTDGYLTFVGRLDDVFKSSDYRLSPFELESVLIEHPAVVEAAVVPSPDAMRLAVAKAFVTLVAGVEPDAATAQSIFRHVRTRVSPFKRIRRLEFASLPKTISGKIRRVELRQAEAQRADISCRRPLEFWEEDFPQLKDSTPS